MTDLGPWLAMGAPVVAAAVVVATADTPLGDGLYRLWRPIRDAVARWTRLERLERRLRGRR